MEVGGYTLGAVKKVAHATYESERRVIMLVRSELTTAPSALSGDMYMRCKLHSWGCIVLVPWAAAAASAAGVAVDATHSARERLSHAAAAVAVEAERGQSTACSRRLLKHRSTAAAAPCLFIYQGRWYLLVNKHGGW